MGVTVIGGSAAAGGAAKTLGTHTLTNKVGGEDEKTVDLPSTFTRDGNNIGAITSGSYGHCWNGDGTRIYYNYGSDDIYYSNMDSGYDFATASSAITAISNINTNNDGSPQFRGMTFNGDGTKFYMVNHDARNEIYVTDVVSSTAYDLASGINNGVTYTLGTDLGITTPGDTGSWNGNGANILKFNDDGTKLFIKGSAVNRIFEIPMTTGYDLSTAGTVVEHDLNTTLTTVQTSFDLFDIDFTDDGKYAYCGSAFTDALTKTVIVLEMTTAFDLSTASALGGSVLSGQAGIYVLLLTGDQDKFVIRASNATTHQLYPSKYKKHRGKNVTATLDVSSGDTFVLSDATNFNRVDLQFSNAPADGTLKSFDVTVANALSKINLTDLKYTRRGGGSITSASTVNADLNLPSTTGGSFVLAGKDINDIWISEDTGNNRIWNWQYVNPEVADGNVRNYANNLIGPEFVLNEYLLPYASNTGWRAIAINPYAKIVYAYNQGLDSLASFYPGINPGYGGSLIHEVDTPVVTDSNFRYWLSNDGKYLYEAQHDADATVKNYQLTTPWDLSTLNSTVASTGTLASNGDQTDGAVAVGFNGKFLFYKGSGDWVYASEMTTAHDLSTLTGNFDTEILLDTNSQNLTVPTDNYGFTLPVGSSNALRFEQYLPTEINMYVEPPLTSVGKPNGIDFSVVSGTSKTFNFTTVDGGSSYYIKEV